MSGFFVRHCNSQYAEYASQGGCHTTPVDNLRASLQPATPTATGGDAMSKTLTPDAIEAIKIRSQIDPDAPDVIVAPGDAVAGDAKATLDEIIRRCRDLGNNTKHQNYKVQSVAFHKIATDLAALRGEGTGK